MTPLTVVGVGGAADPHRRDRRRALSALELAAVVAILGIIVSLALPVANTARAEGQRQLAEIALVTTDQRLHLLNDRSNLPATQDANDRLQMPANITIVDTAPTAPETVQLATLADLWVASTAAGPVCMYIVHDPGRQQRTRWATEPRDGPDTPCGTNRLAGIAIEEITGRVSSPTDLATIGS